MGSHTLGSTGTYPEGLASCAVGTLSTPSGTFLKSICAFRVRSPFFARLMKIAQVPTSNRLLARIVRSLCTSWTPQIDPPSLPLPLSHYSLDNFLDSTSPDSIRRSSLLSPFPPSSIRPLRRRRIHSFDSPFPYTIDSQFRLRNCRIAQRIRSRTSQRSVLDRRSSSSPPLSSSLPPALRRSNSTYNGRLRHSKSSIAIDSFT